LEIRDAAYFNRIGVGRLPGLLGIVVTAIERGQIRLELPVRAELLAPNGYLHAGTVVTLADTGAGYGCTALLDEGETFTTIELASNFLGTARQGTLVAEGRARHLGRTTQIWDVEVSDPARGKTLALFRCTQLILRPGR
jgi:1,4-dihydroxy-2-naphthoyl-CoA hydrolase